MEQTRKKPFARLLAALLTVALLLGALPPAATQTARAASWMDPFLEQVVDWDVMRGDQPGDLNPERNITRAEFAAMINRAFGYTKTGTMHFTDVPAGAWYADDINIAYTAGYLEGTSPTTASPNATLTREQAVVILGRNLMYQTEPGEVLGFTDSRTFSDWSKGYIRIASQMGIVGGYPDGTFRPRSYITRGETAAILVRAIGNLIQEPGETTLGGVYGNVVINTSGVHLHDTIIAGNLYITGGVGLGDVLLTNVTVLGTIVVSGAGESSAGQASVILRNVSANAMVLDSMSGQFVTVRAEGDTTIATTTVRTDAYLADATDSDYGLLKIELDGEAGTSMQVAGNIKEVVNMTPDSHLTIAQGPAEIVTIDEEATNSTLTIANGATVGNLNLDVGTTVEGEGDIGHANVNAPGSTIEMLPDTIVIRPGIEATVDGEVMDSNAAAESSSDPRLLAGYPTAKNVAPTSADGVFAANKRATIYWALSATADGSVGEEDLINPPAYGGTIIQSGSSEVSGSSDEASQRLTGLVSDGSYYISAIAVDNRGQRSPVKVAAFSTPDDTVPAFTSGYPYMSKITSDAGQVAVMANKSCQLYYAVFPRGSAAPTVQDFKTGSLSGNLGTGVRDVTKNVIDLFYVNNQKLQELVSYDLYLCLIDADGGLNSGVQRLTFTTVDGTPPVFLNGPNVTNVQLESVGLQAVLNEAGTIYWMAVAQGTQFPMPMAGKPLSMSSMEAKLQVVNGINAISSGSVNTQGNRTETMNVLNLEPETGYDLYYVAQDTAGNYSSAVQKITIHTLDNNPPDVSLEFSATADEDSPMEPLPTANVTLVFDEGIKHAVTDGIFYDLYQDANDQTLTEAERNAAQTQLTENLRTTIVLQYQNSNGRWEDVASGTSASAAAHWIDYSKAEVAMRDGNVRITFNNETAIKLISGGTYRFVLNDIADTSDNSNRIEANKILGPFTTVFAQLDLSTTTGIPDGAGPKDTKGEDIRVDMSFNVDPASTGAVDSSITYDMFLWSDSIISFELYSRVLDANGKVPADGTTDPLAVAKGIQTNEKDGWNHLGTYTITAESDEWRGVSVFRGNTGTTNGFPALEDLKEGYRYQYVISVTRVGSSSNWESWSQQVTIGVTLPAGPSQNVGNVAAAITQENWDNALNAGLASNGIRAIGNPEDFQVYRQFTDVLPPEFVAGYPAFIPGDSFVDIDIMLNRAGTVYYVIAPLNGNTSTIQTLDSDSNVVTSDGAKSPPTSVTDDIEKDCPQLSQPTAEDIFQGNYSYNDRIRTGSVSADRAQITVPVENLQAETTYFAYFVLRGESQNLSRVYVFQFTTVQVDTPAVILEQDSPSVNVMTTATSDVSWILLASDSVPSFLSQKFSTVLRTGVNVNNAEYKADLDQYSSGNTDPSILEAMMITVQGNRSLFDKYVNEATYTRVLELIKRTGSDLNVSIAANGTLNDVTGTWEEVNCEQWMTEETQYYFLAAGCNVQGNDYGFKAVGSVHRPDRTPPTLLTPILSVDQLAAAVGTSDYNRGDWKGNPDYFQFKGEIVLNFDEPIYQLTKSGVKNTLTRGDFVKALSYSSGLTLTVSGDPDAEIGSTVRINYEGARDGYSIVVFEDGTICDVDSNSHGGDVKLRLTFHTRRTAGEGGSYVDIVDPHWEYDWPPENN